MANYYVIRVNYDDNRERILDQIQKGVLRQGWGRSGMVLDNQEQFVEAWRRAWDDGETDKRRVRKFRNLNAMKNIEPGDIIIVPKAPENRCFLLLNATGKYQFDSAEKTFGDECDDFRHCVPVETIKTVNYDYSDASRAIVRYFRAYQSAVNIAYASDFAASVNALLQEKTNNLISGRTELSALAIRERPSFTAIKNEIIGTINSWGPDKLEKIISELFTRDGYVRVGSNSYDKKGGDRDLTFAIPANNILGTIASLSDESTVNNNTILPQIHIQAKNKCGIDATPQEGISQLLQMRDDNAPSIDILINTSDEIPMEIRENAARQNVMIIDGNQFALLLLQYGLLLSDDN